MRYLLPDDIARETAELARRPGCRVTPLGDEPLRRWLQVLQLGTGRVHVAVKGNAHADEPAGPVTCLRFARWLLDDPAGQALAADVTFHLLPTANPAGLLRNRGWLVGPEGDLERWFEHVDRDPPAADREFGYGDTPAQAAHPECAAWHGYLDALPRVDGYVSLHSMAFAGGAWFLTQLDDLARRQPLLTALARVAADGGLPLHDEDRGGRKGFVRLQPGFCQAPTREAMAAYFRHAQVAGAADWLRLNSMQVVQRRHGTPVALVSELPQWWTPELADLTPVAERRAAVDTATGQGLLATLAELTALGPADELAAEIAHRRATAEALLGLAATWGDQAATRRDVAAGELSVRRAEAQNAALARRVGAGGSDWAAELSNRVGQLQVRFGWQATPLEAQVTMQQAMLVALAGHVCETAG